MSVQCEATAWGATQWCGIGKHNRCGHRVGGSQEHGVWIPECYVTVPASRGSTLRVCPPSQPKVISPSHVYRCPCECHQFKENGESLNLVSTNSTQLELFGAVS